MKELKKIIAQMTVEEKASFCSGKDFWNLESLERLGIPSILITDGPHGLRKRAGNDEQMDISNAVPATCFPTASALAATWDRELIQQVGAALGEECRQEKVGVILGPGANIKRSPLCGRNFEYFSEDPYLCGEMAKSHIQGVQSQGIGTSLKHYAVNNQEYRRLTIDVQVDERALSEIYLRGFEIAVRGSQPWTLMCAYNKVNGTYCCEHELLLKKLLKEEWGHEGLVMTDWGAMNDRVLALKNGLELEMPGVPNGNDEKIVAAVRAGELDESVLDHSVELLLEMIFKAEETLSEDYHYDVEAHHALARKVAAEGAVLLKNEDALLPLKPDTKVALIGRFAKQPRYQGAGSSLMNPTILDDLYTEMGKLIPEENLLYANGYSLKGNQPDEALIAEALKTAAQAEVVILHVGLPDIYEVEAQDRADLKLAPEHEELIKRVAAQHEKIVVVLSNGAPLEMPWANDVSAILEGYLGGQAGGGALADVLYGAANPSGKLAETFPLKLEDNPSHNYFPGGKSVVEYRESIYVGYRHFDTVKQDVLFPFGHGLSYTNYEYSDLRVEDSEDTLPAALTLKVKNTGERAGKEIVQVYVRDVKSALFRPDKELKGFAKVELQPGEEKLVRIELDVYAFAYYHSAERGWTIEPGQFDILVGTSSRDIRLRETLQFGDADAEVDADADADAWQRYAAYFQYGEHSSITKEDFEKLLGRKVPQDKTDRKGEFTLNTPMEDIRSTLLGRLVFGIAKGEMAKIIAGKEDAPNSLMMVKMLHEMPLRNMLMMGDGPINKGMLDGLLTMLNGKFFKGLFALLKAMRE